MLTEAQLEKRLNYICGSDASTVCGKNPYSTKVQLWLEKTRRETAPDISDKDHIKFGNYMEDGIARWFSAETGIKLKPKSDEMLIHPTIPCLAGNPDYIVDGENAALECKSALKPGLEWGDGENIIPDQYLLQVAHYCAVGGFDKIYIAVVFAFRQFRWYVYERNHALEEKLIKREVDFWKNHVLADVCPDAENEEDILALYKETNSNPIIAEPEIVTSAMEYTRIAALIKKLEDDKEKQRQTLALYMKDHDALVDPNGNTLVTWKYTKNCKRFEAKQLEKENPEIYQKYIRETPGYRRFIAKGELSTGFGV